MSQVHRTLPIRVPPRPGEALDSWLEALAARLQCPLGDLAPALGLALLRAGDPHHRGRKAPNWTIALHEYEARTLADGCELGIGDVHALTLMRYHQRAVIVRPDTRQVHRDTLWGRANGSRYCPPCLAASGGRWQLSWRLGWSFACTVHRALLADVCWRCGRHQRLRVTPAGTIPVPGTCTNPAGGAGRRVPRCGADLAKTPVLALPDGHPVLHTQHLILESVHQGTADFGSYPGVPVAEFLTDVRTLSKLLLTLPDHDEIKQHVPADIADAFARARALPHSKSSPSAAPARPGFAAPARAEITATVATVATQALALDDIDHAGTALAWLFAPRPGSRSGQGSIASGYRSSARVLSLQRAALHRPTTAMAHPRQSRTDRTACVPGLFWPAWTVALSPPLRHYRQTFQELGHGLSVLLALTGSTSSIRAASRQLGACHRSDNIALLLHRLRGHPQWLSVEAALVGLADRLDTHGSPIDYQRRRSLDYHTLLPEQEWQLLSRRASHFAGQNRKHPTVQRWLFERISGMPAEQAPSAFALTELRQRREVSEFSRLLTPKLLHELDAHAHEFLASQGVHSEPVTWSPPAALLLGRNLPGTDLSQCQTKVIHHLLRDEHLAPRAIGKRLGISIDAVRCFLNEQPAPLNPNQQRANGRLIWTLSQQLTADELKRLHLDEHLSVTALAQRFDVPGSAIADLLRTYGIPRLTHRRRMPDIDPAWLRREYLFQRRPLTALAKEIGVSKNYLNRQAKDLGIPLRPRGAASRDQSRLFGPRQKKIAQDMLASGEHTVRDVADKLGFTPRTIYRLVSKEYWSKAPKRRQTPRDPRRTHGPHWTPETENLGSRPLPAHA
ncbi:TniQ family protein [Streptomyces monomycini]|uniref:TniQ family protein n=1 Tax=Streptomyces monomycini TaxID=371720 RepID=UPI0004AA912A|nr:TniQ family protein [Streptomyces monomycini]